MWIACVKRYGYMWIAHVKRPIVCVKRMDSMCKRPGYVTLDSVWKKACSWIP